MKNGGKQSTRRADKEQTARDKREERSARALRDNLRRRKMQAREREGDLDTKKDETGDSSE